MRASELFAATVVDEDGRSWGRVHDIRISRDTAAGADGKGSAIRVVGLAIGGGQLVHSWGFAEGRATGPWLLRALTARAARRARFLPAQQIVDWGPDAVRFRGRYQDLPLLHPTVVER
jgi:hypothetical protein